MKLENDTLDDMLNYCPLAIEDMKVLNIKFWISKEYTDFPNQYESIEIIKTNVLTEDTILLGTEEQFIKYQLR